MKLLTKYTNGNYSIRLFDDGTKIRANRLKCFIPEFPETLDINISTKCNGKCKHCYMSCTESGKHGDLNHPIFNSLHSGMELAININDLTHPDLENFLIRMKDKHVYVNVTINQMHIKDNIDKLKQWQDDELIYGIGISLTNSKDTKLFNMINSKLKNVVVHVIDGCFTKDDLENLSNHNIKLLILGFKHKGRGIDYYNTHKKEVDDNIEFLRNHLYDYKPFYKGFVFDVLSTENLNIRQIVGEEKWSMHHMGDEGEFTYFIDLVNNQYAVSSTDVDNIFSITNNDTIDTMFNHIRHVSGYINYKEE